MAPTANTENARRLASEQISDLIKDWFGSGATGFNAMPPVLPAVRSHRKRRCCGRADGTATSAGTAQAGWFRIDDHQMMKYV